MTGYNLKEMGYEISYLTIIIFGVLMFIGFFTVPFLPKRSIIAIPREVNRHRLSYLVISLSSLIIMVGFGNGIEESYPNSRLANFVGAIDQKIFSDESIPPASRHEAPVGQAKDNNVSLTLAGRSSASAVFASLAAPEKGIVERSVTPDKTAPYTDLKEVKKEQKKEMRKAKRALRKNYRRAAAAGGSCAMAIFLIFLLAITTCAGVCLVIGGVAAIIGGESVLLALAAIGVGFFGTKYSIKGIMKVSKWCKGDEIPES